jgi:NCS1 family nucleobase:cation symporter-1
VRRHAGRPALRHRDYDEHDLYQRHGRYGDIPLLPLILTVGGTVLGWGLVTNTAAGWLKWQGYLLEPFGLGGKSGAWAGADLGVLVALALGFVGTLLLGRGRVHAQESAAASQPAGEEVLTA